MDCHKMCRVCLASEDENEKFSSIFDSNGEVALMLFNISGVLPVDICGGFPAVICSSCLTEVNQSDALRKRILDANDHYQELAAYREVEIFKENLLELQKEINYKEASHQMTGIKFHVPKVYHKRKDLFDHEKLFVNPIKVKPTKSVLPMIPEKLVKPLNKVSPSCPTESIVAKMSTSTPKSTTPSNDDFKELLSDTKNSPQKNAQPLVNLQEGKEVNVKHKPKEQIRYNIKCNGKTSSSAAAMMQRNLSIKLKKRKAHLLLTQRNRTNPGARIATCYECDTCKKTYQTSRELNNHIESHELLVEEFLSLFETAVSDSRSCTTDDRSSIQESVQENASMQRSSMNEDTSLLEELLVMDDVSMLDENEGLMFEEDYSDGESLLQEVFS